MPRPHKTLSFRSLTGADVACHVPTAEFCNTLDGIIAPGVAELKKITQSTQKSQRDRILNLSR